MPEPTKQDLAVANSQLVPDAAKSRLQEFWRANSKQIASVTAGADKERIMRVTYSLLYRTPKLIQCTPFSLLNGIVLAHQMGLTFGTAEVSLVPFGQEATLIIGYQGKVKLALGSKLISAIHTDLVMDDDMFEYEVTEDGLRFRHRPNFLRRPKPDENNVIGAYCQLRTVAGGVQTKFVSLAEICDARARSRGYNYQVKKGSSDNPWITDFGSMALKTAVHRAMKLAPQDMTLALANAVDDEDQGGAAAIAEGLDPSTFAARDLQEPLVETGKDAAAKVAEEKLTGLGAGNAAPAVSGRGSIDQAPPDQLEQQLRDSLRVISKDRPAMFDSLEIAINNGHPPRCIVDNVLYEATEAGYRDMGRAPKEWRK